MTDEELTQLLKDAQSRERSMRESAEIALARLDDLEVARAEKILVEWSSRSGNLLVLVGLVYLLLLASVVSHAVKLTGLGALGYPITVLIVSLIGVVMMRLLQSRLPDYRIGAIHAMLGRDEARTAGRLIVGMDVLPLADGRHDSSAHLSKILPGLQLDDLEVSYRRKLYDLLVIDNLYNAPELLSSILEFVDRTGDVEAYVRVRELANSPAVSPGAQRVREQARNSLAILEPLAKQARLRESLLRPYDAAINDSSLLRPAGTMAREDELLVRVADPPDAIPGG